MFNFQSFFIYIAVKTPFIFSYVFIFQNFTLFYKHDFVFIFLKRTTPPRTSFRIVPCASRSEDLNNGLFIKNRVPLLTTPSPGWYLCGMKTKFHCTRGEWAAALFLLSIMTAGNIYYFVCENHPKPSCDVHQYEALFQHFAFKQQQLDDSLAALRETTLRSRPAIRADTLPPHKNLERKPMYDVVKLDINSCDTDQLVTVPQFGSKRAAKLLEYRDRLGGLYCFSQLQEVYVLQNIDTLKLKSFLFINKQKIRKLNINTASYQELVSHPYIDAYLTKLILKHREKNGAIRDLDELQRITHAYPELIEKLKPYLVF